jgi:hypothetical protein
MNRKLIYPKQRRARAGGGPGVFLLLALALSLGRSTPGKAGECPLHLILQSDLVDDVREVGAKESITAEDYVVAQGGSIVFTAGDRIELAEGFVLHAGSVFSAVNDADVECPDDDDDSDPSQNIIAQHDVDSEQYEGACSDCHAEIHSRTSLDSTILPAHRGMFPFAPGRPGSDEQCVSCHRTVDLVQGTQIKGNSLGNLRRHVDVRVCTLCHGPYRGPGQQYYQSGLSPTNPDGPLLYGLVCSGCHGPLENSEVEGESAEEIQDNIDEDEGGMGVLEVLTTEEVNALAAALDR